MPQTTTHAPMRVRTITKTGSQEISRDTEARVRAETVIEGDTIMVHTLMLPDGTGSVYVYKRPAYSATAWTLDSKTTFGPDMPTRFRSNVKTPT